MCRLSKQESTVYGSHGTNWIQLDQQPLSKVGNGTRFLRRYILSFYLWCNAIVSCGWQYDSLKWGDLGLSSYLRSLAVLHGFSKPSYPLALSREGHAMWSSQKESITNIINIAINGLCSYHPQMVGFLLALHGFTTCLFVPRPPGTDSYHVPAPAVRKKEGTSCGTAISSPSSPPGAGWLRQKFSLWIWNRLRRWDMLKLGMCWSKWLEMSCLWRHF